MKVTKMQSIDLFLKWVVIVTIEWPYYFELVTRGQVCLVNVPLLKGLFRLYQVDDKQKTGHCCKQICNSFNLIGERIPWTNSVGLLVEKFDLLKGCVTWKVLKLCGQKKPNKKVAGLLTPERCTNAELCSGLLSLVSPKLQQASTYYLVTECFCNSNFNINSYQILPTTSIAIE